jgi:Ras-related protein Rab-1A
MVYDVTQRESFSKVRDWLLEVDKYASAETAKLLIGNKSDRTDRAVTTEEGQALARELSLPFLETSARIGDNVEAAFKEITEQLIKSRISKREEAERARVELTAQKVQTQSGGKSGCC